MHKTVTGNSRAIFTVDLDRVPGVEPIWEVNLHVCYLDPWNHIGKGRETG